MNTQIAWIVRAALSLWLALMIPGAITPAAAQCQPRSDWGIYVVVRGDTLSRIAQRYQTTVPVLAGGNCLTNVNRIIVGQRLRVPGGGPRGGPAPVPGPTPQDQRVPATFQAYQSGFMLWRADTGEIWAYVGDTQTGGRGSFQSYTSAQYGRLGVQPVTAPPGFVAPIMGFNRVWNNFGDLKRRLGWATSTELSYSPWVRTIAGAAVSFTLPSGLVALNTGTGWMVTGTGNPVPFPPEPVEPVSRIVAFSAPPGPLQVGDTLTITWKIEGTPYALLTIWDGETNVVVRRWESLPAEGAVTTTVPTMLTSEMRLIVQAAEWTATTPAKQWTTRASAGLTIAVLDRPTSVTTQAAYQPYAQGFMVWRQDTGLIYVFGLGVGQFPQSSYEWLPDNACTDLAPGMICPSNGFGRVWASETYVRRALGWPTGPEQSYQATIVTRGPKPLSVTLPDGRKVLIDDTWNWHD